MVVTRVGYAGGSTKDPTYYKMGDHTEVVDILYDPKLTSFEVLVKVFLVSRDHTKRSSRQYRSIILFHEDQKETAARLINSNQNFKYIEIEQFQDFHRAENKHQKNALRRHPGLFKCFHWEDCIASSFVATRLNGYVSGHGTMANFNREWKSLGLSARIAEYVRNVIIKKF